MRALVTLACMVACWAATATAGAQSACGALGGTVDGEQVCHVVGGGSGYKFDFSFPADYPDQQEIADFLTEQRDDFAVFAQSPPAHDYAYLLAVDGQTYRSGSSDSGTRSVVLELSRDANPHPVTSYKAFNYDLATHTPITFATLFKPGIDPLEVLNPLVRREFGPLPLGDPDENAYQNFAISDDAVIFYFSQGGLLAHVDGPQQLSVPRADIASLLA